MVIGARASDGKERGEKEEDDDCSREMLNYESRLDVNAVDDMPSDGVNTPTRVGRSLTHSRV